MCFPGKERRQDPSRHFSGKPSLPISIHKKDVAKRNGCKWNGSTRVLYDVHPLVAAWSVWNCTGYFHRCIRIYVLGQFYPRFLLALFFGIVPSNFGSLCPCHGPSGRIQQSVWTTYRTNRGRVFVVVVDDMWVHHPKEERRLVIGSFFGRVHGCRHLCGFIHADYVLTDRITKNKARVPLRNRDSPK